VPDEGEISIELIANRASSSLTHSRLIKRTNVSSIAQRRGRGVIGVITRGVTERTRFREHLFTASTHDYLMFFTNTGRVYVERVHEIPDMGRAAKGRSIANLLELRSDEDRRAHSRQARRAKQGRPDLTQPNFIFATRDGIVKKTALAEFSNIRKGGIYDQD
jgi:DNA gyrase subunit A